tara:strand:+ start:78 stop:182 length:105 start_codon:yes stop_codon:yes gene_type:complete
LDNIEDDWALDFEKDDDGMYRESKPPKPDPVGSK